jgi:type II secretory pathway pseudopilin PulG
MIKPRFARIVTLSLVAIVVAGIALLTVWRLSLESSNRKRLQDISKRGEPADTVALNQSYAAVPNDENAAFVWLDAAANMTVDARPEGAWNKFALPRSGTNLTPDQLDWARGIVRSNQVALEGFRKAAALTKGRYPVDLTPGPNALLPHLTQLRAIGRLLEGEVVVAVADGDSARAVDALKTMLAVGRSLAHEPLLISQLVEHAVDAIAFNTTEYAINRLHVNDKGLAELITAFAQSDDSNSLSLALMGERAIFGTMVKDTPAFMAAARGNTSTTMGEDLSWGVLRMTGFFERDFAFGLDALTTNIASARLGDPARFASATNWDNIEVRARKGRYILSGLLLSSLKKSTIRDADDRARARIAQVALAIERYRLAHNNTMPENLSALIPAFLPAVPKDPFDGQPLRLKTRDSGYVVYSIGSDTKDDGGIKKAPKAKEKDPWDVTFTVERIPKPETPNTAR